MIIVEVLSALVRKVVEIGDFIGFNIKGHCAVDILQFVNDTLLLGDGSWMHI